jgi:hypothetical protein
MKERKEQREGGKEEERERERKKEGRKEGRKEEKRLDWWVLRIPALIVCDSSRRDRQGAKVHG